MRKTIHLLLGLTILVGCGSKPKSQALRSGEGQRVQASVGEADDSERGFMPLEITAILQHQQPSEDAPFHKDGGDWTFFECKAAADSNVTFTVGVKVGAGGGSGPFTWGQAMIIVNDNSAGGRFLSLFGKSFLGTIPSPSGRTYEPQRLTISTAILGDDLRRDPEGGFFGERGGWTATKWFPEFDGRSGEVYFNYNLAAGKAEFSEKDAEYADDLVAVFAGALRDGPRPERTPDEKRRVRVDGHELVVNDVASGTENRFSFHKDDWSFLMEECIEWASPQYVKFNGRRLSLIDVTTLKMCFPEFGHEGEFDPHSFRFSTDMRWVLYQGDGIDGPGLFLAPVELPTER